MVVVQVSSVAGGIGASTLAWCLAEASGAWLFDYSQFQGGVLAAAGAPSELSAAAAWPRGWTAETEPKEALALAARWAGTRFFSGGSPPVGLIQSVVRQAESSAPVVLDGSVHSALANEPKAFKVCVAINQPRVLDAVGEVQADLLVVRMSRGGITSTEIQTVAASNHTLFLPHEVAVARAVDLGWGVPPRSKVRRLAAQIWRIVDALDS